ncbi:MAG: hypothetical protein E6I80_07510 [Chloroflexi bacterium]|nr:MAG: hypothetical protein E6I80_07510 [Chloroflexota bacterium]
MIYRDSQAKSWPSALLLGLWLVSCISAYTIFASQQLPTPANMAYGVNVDMTAMIPNTPYTIATGQGGNFFDLAALLGINTLRITDFQWETSGKEYFSATWRYVFDEAERHHLHVILLLEDGGEYSALQQAHTLLGRYGLAHAPALWLVDLYNEPNLSDPQLMTALHEEAAYVREVAPRVPITIGGWKNEIPDHSGKFDWQDPVDIPKFIKMVDIVSPHLYEFEQGARQGLSPRQWVQRFLNAVHQEAQHKSILLEEFGAANGLAPTNESITTGSPSWQASVYRGVLQETAAEYDQGIIGALAWIIAPRPTWSYPHNYEKNMVGWAFVLNQGRHLLPAAREFSAAAHYGQREILLL